MINSSTFRPKSRESAGVCGLLPSSVYRRYLQPMRLRTTLEFPTPEDSEEQPETGELHPHEPEDLTPEMRPDAFPASDPPVRADAALPFPVALRNLLALEIRVLSAGAWVASSDDRLTTEAAHTRQRFRVTLDEMCYC